MQTVGGENASAFVRTNKRTRNSWGPVKARTKGMGIQRMCLAEAGSRGGSCHLIATALSDFRLKALWGLHSRNESVMLSLSSVPVTTYISSLLRIKKMLRNSVKISVQLYCFSCPGKPDDGWSLSGPWMRSRGSATFSLPHSCGLAACTQGKLQYGAGVSRWVRLLGKSLRGGLHPSPWELHSGWGPCSWLLLERCLCFRHVCA